MSHTKQSRPDPGLGFQVEVFEMFEGVSFHSEAANLLWNVSPLQGYLAHKNPHPPPGTSPGP